MMEPQLQAQEGGNGNGNGGGMINGGIGGVSVGGDANGGGIINGVLYVKVMTDEQLEILRT